MSKPFKPLEIVQESVHVPSDGNSLDAILSYPADQQPSALAIVVGPHPLLGGDMTNNVVSGLADGLCESGLATLRFNYSGSLAMSESGTFDAAQLNAFWEHSHTDDEAERWQDLDAAVTFMRALGVSDRLFLVAYSFGIYVAAAWLTQQFASQRVAKRTFPAGIVCVSPTIDKHDLSGLAASEIPKLVIASADDFATDSELLKRVVADWREVTTHLAADRDGHFFRGHEPWLVTQATEFFAGLREPAICDETEPV